MYPKGTIYEQSQGTSSGERILEPAIYIKIIYYFLRYLGAGIAGFVIMNFLFSFGPVLKDEITYDLEKIAHDLGLPQGRKETKSLALRDIVEAQKIADVQKEAQGFGVNSYLSIVIPKIGAASDIIANVDASSEKEYLEALKKGVAHAKGTYFPGQKGTIYLFSHSTDSPANIAQYNAVFFLLRKLEVGDRVIIFFADKKYIYEVEKKLTTGPKDTSWLISSLGEERLILQTCDPPGTTWRRLLIMARPVEL